MGRAWDEQSLMDELHNYLVAADGREDAADKRNADLIRVHETGWKGLAAAVERGLRDIADAIRQNGRQ
jgi:hypothetical protein